MWILGLNFLKPLQKSRLTFMNFMKVADRQGGNGV